MGRAPSQASLSLDTACDGETREQAYKRAKRNYKQAEKDDDRAGMQEWKQKVHECKKQLSVVPDSAPPPDLSGGPAGGGPVPEQLALGGAVPEHLVILEQGGQRQGIERPDPPPPGTMAGGERLPPPVDVVEERLVALWMGGTEDTRQQGGGTEDTRQQGGIELDEENMGEVKTRAIPSL